MSNQSFGFNVRLGLNNVEMLMDLLNVTSERIRKALLIKDITPEYKLAGIEIVDNKDYSYSIMFNFDDESSIDEILDKVIIGG
ncbi:MAG: hypothetical protein J6Y02_19560 [Pseudobutyrivibrio sp.]|nr:hypothetical protein [Pseudobutyrivibrio sp.]